MSRAFYACVHRAYYVLCTHNTLDNVSTSSKYLDTTRYIDFDPNLCISGHRNRIVRMCVSRPHNTLGNVSTISTYLDTSRCIDFDPNLCVSGFRNRSVRMCLSRPVFFNISCDPPWK